MEGKEAQPSVQKKCGFIQRQETTFLKCTKERDPKTKGRLTSGDPQRSACFVLWVSQSQPLGAHTPNNPALQRAGTWQVLGERF